MARKDLGRQPDVDGKQIRRRVLLLAVLIVGVVAVISLVPGLASLRSRFANADPAWLLAGGSLEGALRHVVRRCLSHDLL